MNSVAAHSRVCASELPIRQDWKKLYVALPHPSPALHASLTDEFTLVLTANPLLHSPDSTWKLRARDFKVAIRWPGKPVCKQTRSLSDIARCTDANGISC